MNHFEQPPFKHGTLAAVMHVLKDLRALPKVQIDCWSGTEVDYIHYGTLNLPIIVGAGTLLILKATQFPLRDTRVATRTYNLLNSNKNGGVSLPPTQLALLSNARLLHSSQILLNHKSHKWKGYSKRTQMGDHRLLIRQYLNKKIIRTTKQVAPNRYGIPMLPSKGCPCKSIMLPQSIII